MNKETQIVLLKAIITNIQVDILKESSQYPEEWDGVELRWLLADAFALCIFGKLGERKGKRYLAYRNEVRVRNLL